MKGRAVLPLLAAALLLAPAGCGSSPGVSWRGPGERPAAPAPASLSRTLPEWTPYEERPAPDLSYDESGLEPWRRAYAAFLQQLCASEAPHRLAEGCTKAYSSVGGDSNSYTLYDVDKDGVPELFIRFGNCEAAYNTVAYAFRDGQAAEIGWFGSSHSALYTWPEENALLQNWGHMGYGGMDKYTISGGAMISLGTFFTEDINGPNSQGYTDPSELVPGSSYLNEWYTMVRLPEWSALTLPIYKYGEPAPSSQAGPEENAAARAAIQSVLDGKGLLYGVSGDGFGGDVGWADFSGYCAPDAAVEYSALPTPPQKWTWADFNGDGLDECLLFLEEAGVLPENRSEWPYSVYAVLSFQDGVVYAYCINYLDGYVPHQDGVFYDEARASTLSLTFWKNQCYLTYQYNVPRAPSAPPALWQDAAPQ